jgi:N-acetylglucosamine-6-sulfatase
VLSACTDGLSPAPPTPRVSAAPYSTKPNIVFVLTDDLSNNLVRFMPHVVALQQSGMTFTNYTVTDSLCCPSRSSILTGKFPHNTKVFTNGPPPDGGFQAFQEHGNEKQTFALALQRSGYRTALMGKYLNGYMGVKSARVYGKGYVPPGWNQWAVGGMAAYGEFDYSLNENHKIVAYGDQPEDYLTTVIGGLGTKFVTSSVADRKPFFLELATFAPHSPFTPARQDENSFKTLTVPRTGSFNRVPTHAPRWLAGRPTLSTDRIAGLDQAYAKRVEAVQSVDRMVGDLVNTLRNTGQLENTVFVFSSDNGYHLGEHGLGGGKLTAFDTDIRVPLIVAGPGIAPHSRNDDIVENVDLAPTFEELGGAPVPATVDGRSLVGLLHGAPTTDWRTLAAVEHHGPVTDPTDPDVQGTYSGNPPTYDAIRTANWTYVKYIDGEREFYDRRTDPEELHNIVAALSRARIAALDRTLQGIVTCRGAAQCWGAARPSAV